MINKTNFKQIFTIIFSFVLGGVIMLAILKMDSSIRTNYR